MGGTKIRIGSSFKSLFSLDFHIALRSDPDFRKRMSPECGAQELQNLTGRASREERDHHPDEE